MSWFDFFNRKDYSNVIKFPERDATWKTTVPAEEPPKEVPEKKDAKVYYRFGVTDTNRVAFQMGYSEITMNRKGCQDLIDQLTFFMNQLPEDGEE